MKDHNLLKKARIKQQEQRWTASRTQSSSQSSSASPSSSGAVASVNSMSPHTVSSYARCDSDNGDALYACPASAATRTRSATVPAQKMSMDTRPAVDAASSNLQHSEHVSSSSPDVLVLPRDMDYEAVISTWSFRRWRTLPNGAEFTYNQRFVKGKEGHEEMLLKNIWRHMKYRRDNKEMVEQYVKDTNRKRRRLYNGEKVGGDDEVVDEKVLNDTSSATCAADGDGISSVAASSNTLLMHEDIQNMGSAIHNTAGIAAALAANSSLLEAENSVVNLDAAVPHGIHALPDAMEQFATSATPNQAKNKEGEDNSFIS